MANHKLDTDTHIFFYEQDFYPFSNFSSFNVTIWGVKFQTSEQAYHWKKFSDTDHEVAGIIMEMTSAHEVFKFADTMKQFRRKDWDDVKVNIMREILRAKVSQHDYVMKKLMDSGDRIIVEDSWRDSFWGWGDDKQGQNQLGKLWMELRTELRELKAL